MARILTEARRWRIVPMVFLCFCGTSYLRAQSATNLKLLTTKSCYFEGETATIRATTTGEIDEQFSVTWRLVAAERTLSRGSGKVAPWTEGAVAVFEMAVPLPPLESGVVQALSLEVIYQRGGDKELLTHPMIVFSREAFFGREHWLENLQIKLFDPQGTTAELFDNAEIPYSRLLDLAAIGLVEQGILVIGEGVSLAEHRMLADSLFEAANRGVNVLCLAPSEGEFPLEFGGEGAGQIPAQCVFGRADFLRTFDKRFDVLEGRSRLAMVPMGDQVALRAGVDQGEWTWVELRYQLTDRSARLIVCTWGIVHEWENTPVSRYLLAQIFQDLQSNSMPEEATTNVANQD